jgi:hypothetical protein
MRAEGAASTPGLHWMMCQVWNIVVVGWRGGGDYLTTGEPDCYNAELVGFREKFWLDH